MREEEEARQVAELSVYSATDNPFHDVNLGQQFRWHKKNEKERKEIEKELKEAEEVVDREERQATVRSSLTSARSRLLIHLRSIRRRSSSSLCCTSAYSSSRRIHHSCQQHYAVLLASPTSSTSTSSVT